MATHSSVLAWRIPRMGEPGGLSSLGSHRVGHDWSNLAAAAAAAAVLVHCIYMCRSFSIHLYVDGHPGCLHVLAIVNSAAMNIWVRVSFSVFISSGYMPRGGIAVSYGGFMPGFLRSLHTVSHSDCISLHYKNVPLSPYPLQHPLFLGFLMMGTLVWGGNFL